MSQKKYRDRIRHKHKRQEVRRFINDEKIKRGGCVDCGLKVCYSTVVAFDFDHIDRTDKISTIAQINVYLSREQLLHELSKCVLRCAICHRLKTYADGDYVPTNQMQYDDAEQMTLFEGMA